MLTINISYVVLPLLSMLLFLALLCLQVVACKMRLLVLHNSANNKSDTNNLEQNHTS